MNWKTAMYLNLISAQSRLAEHDRTVETLKDLIAHDATRRAFWQRCLAKLESGYDL